MTDSFNNLFDVGDEEQTNDPRKEWTHMPEFVQDKDEPYAKIIVRFETKEDLDEFSEMIGQKLLQTTKSIWHPKLEHGKNAGLRWVDTDEDFDDDEE